MDKDEKKTCTLKISAPGINKFAPPATSDIAETHVATFEFSPEGKIILTIYFEPKELLGDKIMHWLSANEFDLLKYIAITKIHTPDDLLQIDFSTAKIVGGTRSDAFIEDGWAYVQLNLDWLRLEYHCPYEGDSEFYLENPAFSFIEGLYDYLPSFPPFKKEYSWQPSHSAGILDFQGLQVWLEHRFSVKGENKASTVSINKEPRIRVVNGSRHDIQKQIEVIESLCTVISFYTQTDISYNAARIYGSERFVYIRKIKDSQIKGNAHGMFRWHFHSNPFEFFEQVNFEKVQAELNFLQRTIRRFIYGLNIGDEGKFMLLYSIIESFRNKWVSANGTNILARERFEFLIPKKEINERLRKLLSEVSELVVEEHREKFIDSIPDKVNLIKFLSQKTQMEGYFDDSGISPSQYGLDFSKLKKLRDSIVHGSISEAEYELLKFVNGYKRLPRFVGNLILHFLTGTVSQKD